MKNAVTKALFIVVFSFLYLPIIMYLGINFYFNGSIKKSRKARKNLESLKNEYGETEIKEHKMRFVTTAMFFVVNVALFVNVIYSIGSRGTSLSTPFLLIFGGNMFIYVTYYMVRKIIDIVRSNCCVKMEDEDGKDDAVIKTKSKLKIIPWFSFVLFVASISFGMIAMWFYAHKHQSRNMSPAESRERNHLCKYVFIPLFLLLQLFFFRYGDFFDNHDMWHFLSSIALFLAFLGLLTIDDDLLYIKRDWIKVY